MACEYLFVDMIAEKWGVSKSWVYRLCRAGRVDGAYIKDGRWSVPADAKKPDFIPPKRVRRLKTRKIPIKRSIPLSLSYERIDIQSADRLLLECSEYILHFVDLSPGGGSLLFSALSHPHVTATVKADEIISYSWLLSLKNEPEELYSRISLMLFEFFAISPETRRDYFDDICRRINTPECRKNTGICASYALFLSLMSSGSGMSVMPDGCVTCQIGRKHIEPENLREDIMLLSSLLERARMIPYDDECELEIPEYAAIHISPEQDMSGEYKDECEISERVFVI